MNTLQTRAKATQQPSFAPAQTSILQRKCACGQHTIAGGECEECRRQREGTLQRAAINAVSTNSVPSIVHDVLNSPGQPLDAGTRAFMEPRLGQDFSQVRVHTDARAAESAQAVNALAYTVGRNVVFGTGQYVPGTSEGKRLMAHELTHVVQQRGGVYGLGEVGSRDDSYEQEAEESAASVLAGQSTKVRTGIASHLLQRDEPKQGDAARSDEPVTPQTGTDEPLTGGSAEATVTPEEGESFILPPLTLSKPSPRPLSLFKPGKEPHLELRNSCRTRILAEGTCKDLALGSKYICCDPQHGFKRPGRRTSEGEPGKVCKSEMWTPIFTCDNICKTALETGCNDDDHWMALPPKEFERSKCGEHYSICAGGKKTWGYVRDRSSSKKSYEVSPGIQKTLGIKVGDSFQGEIYPPDTDSRLLDLDPCCNWPPLMIPELHLTSETATGLLKPPLGAPSSQEGAEATQK